MAVLKVLFAIYFLVLLAVITIGAGLWLILPAYKFLPFGVLLIAAGMFVLALLLSELFIKDSVNKKKKG